MAEAEPAGRPTGRRRRSTEPLTERELAALVERDMPAEVAELLASPLTTDNVEEARRRTQEVRLDIEGRLPLRDWPPELFLLDAENAMAEARATAVGYFHPDPHQIPRLHERYHEAIRSSRELLEVVAPSGDGPFPGERETYREQFPEALSIVEGSPERKRAVTTRAFNLMLEGIMTRDVLGAANPGSRYGEHAEERLEYLTRKKDRLVEEAGLAPEDEAAMDQRVTLLAMLTKAKHVVPDASDDLGALFLKTLPHRGEYPEDFLPRIRDILTERMRPVAEASDELEAMRV